MQSRARVLVAIGAVAVVGAIALGLVLRTPDAKPTPQFESRPTRQLDVEKFRADIAKRKAKVEALRGSATGSAVAEPAKPYAAPATNSLVTFVVSPTCNIGPGELCTSLESVIVACDKGDAASCLAVAQYLQDTPPRPLKGVLAFMVSACKRGDQTACARMEEIKGPLTKPCAEEPIGCAYHALKSQDPAWLVASCNAGVADTCEWLSKNVGDADKRRGYLEASCQLGSPSACLDLGQQLAKTDPEQAAAALAIACAAGHQEACK